MSDLAVVDLRNAPITWRTVQAIAGTELIPKPYRGRPEAILAMIFAGREVGMAPLESLRRLDLVDGQITPSGEWLLSRILEAGHLIELVEQSPERVTLVGIRRESGAEIARMSVTWTIDDARRANLAGKGAWKAYPALMLYWRAVTQLARQAFPDCLSGIKYLPDELGADVDPEPMLEAIPEPEPVVVEAEIVEDPEPSPEAIEDVPVSDPTDTPAAPETFTDDAQAALIDVLAHDPDTATMPEIDARLRATCRLAEGLGLVHGRGEIGYLHAALADVGAAHVSELKRTELVNLARSIRAEVSRRYTEWLAHWETDEDPR